MTNQYLYYPTPTIDVDFPTLAALFNARPDIGGLYCANRRPDGRPWCPNDAPDIAAIMYDWWTRVAGMNDAPRLYGNSIAQWARVNFPQIPVQQMPGPVGGRPIDPAPGRPGGITIGVGGPPPTPSDTISSGKIVFFLGAMLAVFVLTGANQDQKLVYLSKKSAARVGKGKD